MKGVYMSTLERRRVIRMSGQTMVLTLPIGWLRMHNIRKGDFLEIITGEKTLFVRVPAEKVEPLGTGDELEVKSCERPTSQTGF